MKTDQKQQHSKSPNQKRIWIYRTDTLDIPEIFRNNLKKIEIQKANYDSKTIIVDGKYQQ
jgi:hypothetical protein